MKVEIRSHQILRTLLLFLLIGAVLALVPVLKRRGSGNLHDLTKLLPQTVRAAEINPWTFAVDKVKEDRGEPMGRQAKIETPSELRHYSDTRRFLATQVAEVKEHQVETPQDLVDLAAMIDRGELVAVPLVTENHILFGVGGSADSGPFTRYTEGKSVDIYNEAELARRYESLAKFVSSSEKQLAGLKLQLSGLKKRERAQRAKLQAEIATAGRELKSNREEKASLDHVYGEAQIRQQLFADYDSLKKIGNKLAGAAFDISDASDRRQMKVRLLASLRPEALKVLEQIAASYHEKFDRPLPVTSLVRPDEYQMRLSKTNPNATRIETPPHSTGLAFDILYRYMTAAEQAFVMSELVRLKDEGRIEVLRENRDHYHVFAFVDGTRPDDEFISAALGVVRPGRTAKAVESHHAAKPSRTAKSTSRKKSQASSKKRQLHQRSGRKSH